MNLTSPSQVQALLRELQVEPSSALGQNFLIDVHIRDIIIEESGVGPEDVVLEVGPGLGVLTEVLARRAGQLIAVEKDHRLAQYLASEFEGREGVRILPADAIELDYGKLAGWGVTKVVSNLPYSVGSRILMELFALPSPPERITVTVQMEVGDRLVAGPGQEARGLLGVWAQRVYRAEVRKIISPTCCWPPPKIRSSVVRLDRLDSYDGAGREAFLRLTKDVFGFRRKQMGTILKRLYPKADAQGIGNALQAAGIDPRARPEILTVDEWQGLAGHLEALRQG